MQIYTLVLNFLNVASLSVFIFLFNITIAAQNAPTVQTANVPNAVAELRELYFKRDYEGGYQRGQNLIKQFPDDIELQAWFILNTARNEMSAEAVETAEKLVENKKDSAWANFALAHAYIRNAQYNKALPVAEKVLQLEPDNEEFIFLYNSALLSLERYDEIYVLLDKNSSKIKDKARSQLARAEARYRQATGDKPDAEKKKSSFENFAKAVELNPDSVGANYIYGYYLNSEKRYAEALPPLKKAVALSPNAAQIRQQYWRAILNGQSAKSESERKKETIADISEFLRLRPDSPNALETAGSFYDGALEMYDKGAKLDDEIAKKFPQSPAAETILYFKIRTFDVAGKDKKPDERKKTQFTAMLKDYVSRPKHYRKEYLGEVYSILLSQLANDAKISNAELLQIAENVAKYSPYDLGGTYSSIAKILARRKMYREAEKFVNKGFEKVPEKVEQERADTKDEKRVERYQNGMNAALHHSLGTIYYEEKRLDDAEKEIAAAIKLDRDTADFYDTQAKIYEAKNEPDKTETAYINAFSTFFGKENPYAEKLKTLYRQRRQTLEGFDAYFERVKETERAMRKDRVLADKISEPKSVVSFNLKNLSSQSLSSADLQNKVVVINIWGTWCGPCVMEMPEFQQLHKKYAGAKDVVILTINNDEDLDTIKKFMSGKKYDFAVLRDENYLSSVGINTFPTTWFINRNGQISFIKIGASDKLLEEFGWRIEELRK